MGHDEYAEELAVRAAAGDPVALDALLARIARRAAEQYAADHLPEAPDPRTTSVIPGSRLDLLDALDQPVLAVR